MSNAWGSKKVALHRSHRAPCWFPLMDICSALHFILRVKHQVVDQHWIRRHLLQRTDLLAELLYRLGWEPGNIFTHFCLDSVKVDKFSRGVSLSVSKDKQTSNQASITSLSEWIWIFNINWEFPTKGQHWSSDWKSSLTWFTTTSAFEFGVSFQSPSPNTEHETVNVTSCSVGVSSLFGKQLRKERLLHLVSNSFVVLWWFWVNIRGMSLPSVKLHACIFDKISMDEW